MDEIKNVYNRDIYQPFVDYCKEHGYKTMRDLSCYDFRLLSRRPEFSSLLITRIKAVYAAYQKSDIGKEEAAVKRRPRTTKVSAVVETQLLLRLREFFVKNSGRAITLDELFREVEGEMKRTRISKLLAEAPWCQKVETGIYFYAPIKEIHPAQLPEGEEFSALAE